jgi:galactose mutarotase-like enzyme
LTVFPHLGGKIASLRLNDRELLQAPIASYGPRTRTMSFDSGDASGWDECLPSVADCSVETAAGTASIPDHGDLWRVAWQPVARSQSSATFRAQCFSLPLALERAIALTELENPDGKSWQLRLDYKVTNTGGYPAPWSWAAHPLFTAEAGDRIVLPESIHMLRLEGSGGGRLGKGGDQVSWPIAALAKGGQTDLSVAQSPQSGIGDKLFAGPLSESENWCVLERPLAGVRLRVGFDPAATPFLGLWICHGGWPDRPGPKQTCVALEPATAPVDSLARTGPWSRVLAPGESFSWPMTVDLESI